jgi:hypothetical protein
MVALGTAIQAPTATFPVLTTVNQCLRKGQVTLAPLGGAAAIHGGGALNVSQLRWVHHDGIGYFFPTPSASANITAETRSGTWQSINTTQSSASVSKDVFSLQIQHGSAVSNDSYAYVAAPVATAAEMPNAPAFNIGIARNDDVAQAVTDTAEKAKVTGVPKDILMESYNRGMAAWRTGHRPFASQQQWGHARVSSFLLCGKTYHTTDSDLVYKAKKSSVLARKWWSKQKQCLQTKKNRHIV